MLGLAAALVGEGAEQGDGPRPGVGSDQGPTESRKYLSGWALKLDLRNPNVKISADIEYFFQSQYVRASSRQGTD